MIQPFGYEDITVAATSKALTAATYSNGDYARIKVEGGAVRFRLDGGAPTASVGEALEIGAVLELFGTREISQARFIRRDATSATLRVHYATSLVTM